jgi:hypothetical protein
VPLVNYFWAFSGRLLANLTNFPYKFGLRWSKQPLMVRTFLKVYMELGSYFLFLQEQIKDIIITTTQLRLHGEFDGRGISVRINTQHMLS